jgi:hypothetical protein
MYMLEIDPLKVLSVNSGRNGFIKSTPGAVRPLGEPGQPVLGAVRKLRGRRARRRGRWPGPGAVQAADRCGRRKMFLRTGIGIMHS